MALQAHDGCGAVDEKVADAVDGKVKMPWAVKRLQLEVILFPHTAVTVSAGQAQFECDAVTAE